MSKWQGMPTFLFLAALLALAVGLIGPASRKYNDWQQAKRDAEYEELVRPSRVYWEVMRACGGRLLEENGKHQIWLCYDGVRRHAERP